MSKLFGCLLMLLGLLGACDAESPRSAPVSSGTNAARTVTDARAAGSQSARAARHDAGILPSTYSTSSALSFGDDALPPRTPRAPATTSQGAAASAIPGGTRVKVEPRHAHIIVAQRDNSGQIVTRCVSQLEHPLDALHVPVRHAEIE